MLGETELPLTEKRMIRHQFHQARLELEQWAQLAAAVLAHTTRKAALATPPRPPQIQFRHLELLSLRDCMVLLVMVLQGGIVKQRMLSLEEPLDQEALSRHANELNDRFGGQSAAQIAAQLPELTDPGQQIGQFVLQIIAAEDYPQGDPIYREGLAHILAEPEFGEGEQVRQMAQVLEAPSLLDVIAAASQPLEIGGVQVLIGGEGRWEELAALSLVLTRYGLKGSATGVLGVLGPIRMPYDRTIGAVRYVSQIMTALVSDWYSLGETRISD